jgi:hypothetical protein
VIPLSRYDRNPTCIVVTVFSYRRGRVTLASSRCARNVFARSNSLRCETRGVSRYVGPPHPSGGTGHRVREYNENWITLARRVREWFASDDAWRRHSN